MAEINSVLVTGGAGYIGSLLVRDLLKENYRVRVLDTLFFGDEPIKELHDNENFQLIKGDIRNNDAVLKSIEGIDSIVHLAAIVGDPACAAHEDLAVETNFNATIKLADTCKKQGIKNFVFASTCSVYGQSENEQLTEESKLNPVSLYAETRLYGERGVFSLADVNFCPKILRFGTVYGLSPRMRFDLVVNFLTQKALLEKKISIFGGTQWRPFVHVQDVADSLKLVLEADEGKVCGEIFNVGGTAENYQMYQVGEIINELLPETEVTVIEEIKDKRSYNVNCDKIAKVLGYKTTRTVKDGIQEIIEAIRSGKIKNPKDRRYRNYCPE